MALSADYLTPLQRVAIGCVERSEAMGYKGKRRDQFALDYFCAAAVAFQIAGDDAHANHLGTVAVMLLAARGYSEVNLLAFKARAVLAEAEALAQAVQS